MKNKKAQRGFTLIELMIVIAILAILMAYALPAYRDYGVRTKLGEGNAMSAAYKMAINEAYVRTGSFVGLNNDANGIGPAAAIGYCVNQIQVVNGVIDITYDCAAGSEGVADPQVLAGPGDLDTHGVCLGHGSVDLHRNGEQAVSKPLLIFS